MKTKNKTGFRLLQFLLSFAGNVFSKGFITENFQKYVYKFVKENFLFVVELLVY